MPTIQPEKKYGRTDQAKPEIIMEKVYGMIPGLALLAGLELDIFSRLGERAQDAQSLAASMAVNQIRLLPLLNTLTASGLLVQKAGTYSNRPETIEFLVRGRSGYHDHTLRLIRKILKTVPQTTRSIMLDRPQAKMDWTDLTHNQKQHFQKGQYHGSVQAGRELGAELNLSDAKAVLDGAGGTGGVAHNLIFLNLYEHGRAYTEGEYRSWLSGTGFSGIQVQYDVFSDGTGIITACRN